MKIFEFENGAGGDLLEPNRALRSRPVDEWDRPASAPSGRRRQAPSPPARSAAPINLETSRQAQAACARSRQAATRQEFHGRQLDRGDGAQSQPARTGRRYSGLGLLHRARGRQHPCSTPAAIRPGAVRTDAGRSTACRSFFRISAARNAAARAARHDGRRAGRRRLCRACHICIATMRAASNISASRRSSYMRTSSPAHSGNTRCRTTARPMR